LHHLLHNDFAEKMLNMLNYWVIVEGAAGNEGSTRWCKKIPKEYHDNGSSIDGTVEFFNKLAQSQNDNKGCLITNSDIWKSKDSMVNAAIKYIKDNISNNAFLWQIDCDEQWTSEAMDAAEKELKGDTGMFLCNYYVGPGLVVRGGWGEGTARPYRRLWRWKGQAFKSHEPPVLEGGNGREQLLSQRFNHYAYYYEKDVEFKDKYYGGHEGIYKRWKKLQDKTVFPQPLNILMPGRAGEICTLKQ
jgi:hypothetical protein